MTPGSAESPNRSRWMRAGRECMQAGDWADAIRAYGQGLMEQPLLGMHYAANLERARTRYRQERQTSNQQGPEHTTVVVASAELSHNAAGEAAGQPFPPVGPPAVGADPRSGAVQQQGLPVHSFVVEHEPGFVNQAWELELQQPADLVHLSKPRLPGVLEELDDEELLFVGEREPRVLMGPLWTWLAVDLAQRFDNGFTVANRPLQQALATGRARQG